MTTLLLSGLSKEPNDLNVSINHPPDSLGQSEDERR